MMIEHGLVRSVQAMHLGSFVSAAASSGATSLVVESILDFNEAGGELTLNGVTYPYSSADYTTNTITLASGLTGAAAVSDRVGLSPVTVETTALVEMTGVEDPIRARVPHTLVDRMAEGIRVEGQEESVQLKLEDGDYTVLDVIGKDPVVDGSYIDPSTLPPPGTDGLPPASTPALTATGNIGAIHYRWTPVANADPVKFNLHVSTTPGFTVGPGNLVMAGSAGSSFTYVPSPLDYTATYYARLVEYDDDGEAAPSAEVSAQLRQATNEDISAAYAYLGQVVFDQMVGGRLNVDMLLGSTITTRAGGTGAGLDMNTELTRYDSSGSPTAVLGETNSFKGLVEADGLTVTGAMSVRSTAEVARGATWTLQQGTTAAVAPPTAQIAYPGTINPALFAGNYGLCWTGTDFATIGDSAPVLIQRSADADLIVDSTARPWGGLTRIGTHWYTLGFIGSQWWITRISGLGATMITEAYTPINGTWGSGGSASAGLAPAAIGTDGTNVLIAEFDDANNRYRIQVRNTFTLAVTSTINTTASAGFTGPVVGVQGGNFDFGSMRYVILTRNGPHAYVFNSTGVYDGSEAFGVPATGQMSGITWDGTRFWSTKAKSSLDGAQALVYKHTTNKWYGADPKTYYAALTWRDTNPTGGTHETNMSPVVSFSMRKRAGVAFTSPAIPPGGGVDDPNAVAFYLGQVDTTRTNLWRQTLPADGVNTVSVGDDITFAGTNPPAANDFPSATPGKFASSAADGLGNPHLLLEGDGDIFRGPNAARLLTQVLTAPSTNSVDLTTTEADITGATVTFTTLRPNARYLCMGSFYFSAIGASGHIASGKLSVDGTTQTPAANFTGDNATPARTNSSQTWSGTLATAGSHTLKLRGVSGAAGVHRVNAGSTTITVFVFE
jgi:hypothetical protein